jgi:hypothetical protein
MTEAEWLTSPTAERLLNHIKGRAGERKLRLYGGACCRRCWSLLDARSRLAVEVAERFADGLCDADELIRARQRAEGAARSVTQAPKASGCWGGVRDAARAAVEAAAHGPVWKAAAINDRIDVCEAIRATEKQAQAAFLRCIFGNPFRPVALGPAQRTPLAAALAAAAYDERSTPAGELGCQRLAVLADALEETGGAPGELLDHLRGPGPHVRGCFAVDLLLGKE